MVVPVQSTTMSLTNRRSVGAAIIIVAFTTDVMSPRLPHQEPYHRWRNQKVTVLGFPRFNLQTVEICSRSLFWCVCRSFILTTRCDVAFASGISPLSSYATQLFASSSSSPAPVTPVTALSPQPPTVVILEDGYSDRNTTGEQVAKLLSDHAMDKEGQSADVRRMQEKLDSGISVEVQFKNSRGVMESKLVQNRFIDCRGQQQTQLEAIPYDNAETRVRCRMSNSSVCGKLCTKDYKNAKAHTSVKEHVQAVKDLSIAGSKKSIQPTLNFGPQSARYPFISSHH